MPVWRLGLGLGVTWHVLELWVGAIGATLGVCAGAPRLYLPFMLIPMFRGGYGNWGGLLCSSQHCGSCGSSLLLYGLPLLSSGERTCYFRPLASAAPGRWGVTNPCAWTGPGQLTCRGGVSVVCSLPLAGSLGQYSSYQRLCAPNPHQGKENRARQSN